MNKVLLGVIAAVVLVQASAAMACSSDGKEGIAPKNNLWIPASKFAAYTISEEDFLAVTKKAQDLYGPVLESQGRVYKMMADWNDGTVNAYANRSGNVSEVHMFGGLARHPKMTKDGFMLVICHETGHHIAGAPRKGGTFGGTWASNEGQSDYYATFSCARKVWADENNEEIVAKLEVPTVVTERCQKSFNTASEIAICKRAAMAGKDLGDTLGDLNRSGDTDFNKPDTSAVTRTNDNHPAAQCRTDTYFAGAVCAKLPKDILSATDATAEACSTEKADELGVRPVCWYKPFSNDDPAPTPPGGGSSWPSVRFKKRVQASR